MCQLFDRDNMVSLHPENQFMRYVHPKKELYLHRILETEPYSYIPYIPPLH
jgi:hypothetical protein